MNELAQQLEEQINGSAGGSGAGTKVPAEATAETAPYFQRIRRQLTLNNSEKL